MSNAESQVNQLQVNQLQVSQLQVNQLQVNQLRATLSKMEIALGTIDDAIVWTNRHGQIKWCNPAFERLLGRSQVMLVGTVLVDQLPLQQDNAAVASSHHPFNLALTTHGSGKADYQFPDFSPARIVEIAWRFVASQHPLAAEAAEDQDNDEDEAEGVVLVLRDVTQQRLTPQQPPQTERVAGSVAEPPQAPQRTDDHLQQEATQVQTLLTELQTVQNHLIQAEKMSSLGQLVAGIAHEINNPVNFIYGNLAHVEEYAENLLSFVQLYAKHYPNPAAEIVEEAEVIDLEFLQEDLPKLIRSMKVGTDRIRNIVLSLRNFSRVDESECKATDIHEGINSTLLILQHRLKASPDRPEVEITRDFGDLPLVECYPGQLNQVFMNILANAIDAIEERHLQEVANGSQTVSGAIAISTSILGTDQIKIIITDNGLGMTEAVQTQIFQPFFTTKPIGKGTGIGMSISHQIIVERHGGQLTCASQLGQGTEFVIQIPIHQVPEPEGG